MTELVDASSGAVTRQSFDAWGNKRDVSDWTIPSTYNLFADRGFTGHEHLEEFELINMNGRVYDPALGRFLSPDPYVQMPDFSQSFNRYSYCLNNPLVYTDPNGESFLVALLLKALYVTAGQYVINWLDNVINDKMSPKEAFRNTPIVAYVEGTIPYKEKKPPINSYNGSNGSSISGSDINSPSRIEEESSISYYSNTYMAALEGVHSPEFISLGTGKPFITRTYYWTRNDQYGRYELDLQVYGKMYDEYNWVQTCSWRADLWKVDPDNFENNHGFYYNDWDFKYVMPQYKAPDADFFFMDEPNAVFL